MENNIPEIESYFESLIVGGKSPHTIRTYKKDCDKFCEYFKVSDVSDIQKLGSIEYRKFIGDLGLSPSSINGCIRNISAMLHWLEDNGYISNCKFFGIKFGKGKFIKQSKVKKDVLTDEESARLINAGKNKQNKFMLAFLLWTGVRNQELRNIKLSDISGEDVIINGKGSKQRTVSMNPILFKMYEEYLKERHTDSEYLFYSGHSDGIMTGKSILDRVYKACEDAGIDKKIGTHRLRGTCLTNIIKESGLVAAKNVAGHSNINVTMIYDETSAEWTKEVMKGTTRTFGFS